MYATRRMGVHTKLAPILGGAPALPRHLFFGCEAKGRNNFHLLILVRNPLLPSCSCHLGIIVLLLFIFWFGSYSNAQHTKKIPLQLQVIPIRILLTFID